MSSVFVIDSDYKPLNPVHPARARLLLTQGKAAVYRRYPFTIILKQAVDEPEIQPLRLKLDPGSKTTGFALVNDANGKVVFAAELSHRGQAIKSDGTYVGRVAVRRTGSFNIATEQGTVQGIRSRFCQPVHRSNGYSYRHGEFAPLPQ